MQMPVVTELFDGDDLAERRHGDSMGALLSDREECEHDDEPGHDCTCESFETCPDFESY